MKNLCILILFGVLLLSSCYAPTQKSSTFFAKEGNFSLEAYDNSMHPSVAKIDVECKKLSTYRGILNTEKYQYCYQQKINEQDKDDFLKQLK